MLQQFYLDLEKFLAWLTEAETTANVLQDATHKEKILEDAKAVRELMKQWQVNQVLQFRDMSGIRCGEFFSSAQLLNKTKIVLKKRTGSTTNVEVLLWKLLQGSIVSHIMILSDIFQHKTHLKNCLEVQP